MTSKALPFTSNQLYPLLQQMFSAINNEKSFLTTSTSSKIPTNHRLWSEVVSGNKRTSHSKDYCSYKNRNIGETNHRQSLKRVTPQFQERREHLFTPFPDDVFRASKTLTSFLGNFFSLQLTKLDIDSVVAGSYKRLIHISNSLPQTQLHVFKNQVSQSLADCTQKKLQSLVTARLKENLHAYEENHILLKDALSKQLSNLSPNNLSIFAKEAFSFAANRNEKRRWYKKLRPSLHDLFRETLQCISLPQGNKTITTPIVPMEVLHTTKTMKRGREYDSPTLSKANSTSIPLNKMAKKQIPTTIESFAISGKLPLLRSSSESQLPNNIRVRSSTTTSNISPISSSSKLNTTTMAASVALTSLHTVQLTASPLPKKWVKLPEVAQPFCPSIHIATEDMQNILTESIAAYGTDGIITTINLSSTHSPPPSHILIHTCAMEQSTDILSNILPKRKLNLEIFITDFASAKDFNWKYLQDWSAATKSILFLTFPTRIGEELTSSLPPSLSSIVRRQLAHMTPATSPFRHLRGFLLTT